MSCPEGLIPSVDYITCELDTGKESFNGVMQYTHKGRWKDPMGREQFIMNQFENIDGIICLKPKCEDLNEKFFDETVDVSSF